MLSIYSYKLTPDFVISEIAKWAVLKGIPARKMTIMTVMTDDSF